MIGVSVHYTLDGEPHAVGPMAATSYEITGLTPATSYSVTLTAYDTDGNVSAPTTPLTASTTALPPALTLASLQVAPDILTVGATAVVTLTVNNIRWRPRVPA